MHDIRPYLPQLFDEPGTMLYIGARFDAHSWLDIFVTAGHDVTILEIWKPNVKKLIDYDVILGDVRTTELNNYDYVIWWHGPEHIKQDELKSTLDKLEQITNKILAVACPYGLYPQGCHNGNPYETHLSTIYPETLIDLGFEIATDGERDTEGSEIVAWKINNG